MAFVTIAVHQRQSVSVSLSIIRHSVIVTYPAAAVRTSLLLNKYVNVLHRVHGQQTSAWAKLHNHKTINDGNTSAKLCKPV